MSGFRISPQSLRFGDDAAEMAAEAVGQGSGFVTGGAGRAVQANNVGDQWTDRLLVLAAALTGIVSAVLFVSLILRDSASLNPLNMVTLLGSSASVLAALYFSRNFAILLMSYVAFVVTVAPSPPGGIAFLYVPSFAALTIVLLIRLAQKIVR